ncbi:UNC93-like protein [Araneus ventricosus]|uniref:UNC93-like protein n=1 Tax=Araneus ventricosus TaxID=182803 RepID=A0A4Y2V6T5_ARAVE|nr:UNC93-like protein [Araneus ventricosus]
MLPTFNLDGKECHYYVSEAFIPCLCFVDRAMQLKTQHPASEAGAQQCPNRSFTRLQMLKNVTVICAGVLLLFTAYDGMTMLQSTMNRDQGIGVWSQAIMYFFFSVSAIFFPKYVIKKFGTKITYVLSMVAYIPYIASNFYSHWVLVVPVSILIGLGAALIWGAQASYLNNVSVMYVDIGMNSNGKNGSEKNISCISNNITFWGSEKKDNRSVSCDLASFKSYFRNDEKNVTLKSYENVWLKRNSIAAIGPKSGIDNFSNISAQQDKYKTSVNDQFYSAPFKNAENFNVVENNETNSKVAEVGKNSDGIKKRRKMIESTTARFFGFHGVAYLTCHLWGNLITYFILQTDVDMNAVSNSSCVCGADFCNIASECFEQNIEQPSERIRYILTGTCVCIAIIAVLIVAFFLDPLESEKKEEVTFSMDLLMATYKLAKKKELIFLIPASFYIGMVQGFYTGDFTKSFVGCAWGTYHVGLVAVSYGAMCGISSFSSGWLVKRVGRIPIFSAASLVNIAACATMLAWRPTAEEPAMFFVIAGMWGVHVGAIWSQLRGNQSSTTYSNQK